ncbi:MAG: hypothetical protein H7A23_17615 [Leptospiraceae bacterium]|nr:hypothetical protein [Leptospiraceae bacterium]MCP5496368.1 hypothetical protein [Leptospiraceae bacterium]
MFELVKNVKVKTFKIQGQYGDVNTKELDENINKFIQSEKIKLIDIKTAINHPLLVYTVIYEELE